jgi:16S rRNA (guanine(527)-N(7))-methyltransferase RsmG
LERNDFGAFAAAIVRAAEENGVGALLNDARVDAFFRLTEHMLTVNEQFNLTAIREPERVILLHYIDSLLGARFFPEGATVIDVGCGAGFPSLPLAIARPDLRITALDSTAKRVHYVKETAEMLGLGNLSTLVARAEDAARDPALREGFDCATARAVAALPVLSELCLPFVKVGGLFVAMKGRGGKEELAQSKNAIFLLGGKAESITDTPILSPDGETFEHTTVLIRKKTMTGAKYPRAYAKIVKAPL